LSHADLLIKKLEAIETKMNQFIDLSEVGHTDWEAVKREAEKGIFVSPPDHYWKEVNESHIKIQTELKQLYSEWKEPFDLLFQNVPESVIHGIEEVHEFVISWIERNRDGNWSVKPTLEENKSFFKDKTEVFHRFIKSLSGTGDSEIILIPDTNSLIICPELQEYSKLIDTSRFTIVFIPTVLQELDGLKQRHPDRDFRKKVDSVIMRIKGFRQQGDLRTGVTDYKTITVKSIATEPNFEKTLHWLDPSIKDDRIIASVLEIQREYLASKVILITNDINLQNKSDMANIPSLEPPDDKG